MSQGKAVGSMRNFVTLWLGQFVSETGNGLTNFAFGVWIYQQTGSATQFTLVALCGSVPGTLSLLVSGVLTDHWNRRRTMILSNAGAALTTLVAAALFFSGRLEVWQIYVGVGIRSIFMALLWPAFSASTTLLVPKRHLGRASGMMQVTQASSQIISPLLTGILLTLVSLSGVLLLDFISYLCALVTLMLVRIPQPEMTTVEAEGKRTLLGQATYGWTYIKTRHGLLALLVYFAIINLVVGSVQLLFTPMILNFASPKTLGVVLSIAGIGFLCGSITMSAWGGPKNRVHGVLTYGFLLGLFCALVGLQPSAALIAAAAFGMFFVLPILNGCSQAIWQSKTPADIQGRVFAMRRFISSSTLPIAFLISGPLADKIFEPTVVGGSLSTGIARIIGNAPGRGIALMFIAAGLLTMLTQLAAYGYRPLLQLEKVPDAIPDVVPDAVLPKAQTAG